MRSMVRGLIIIIAICFVSLSHAFAKDEPMMKKHSMEKCSKMGMHQMMGMEKCPMMGMGMDKKMDFAEKFYHKAHYILMRSEELGLSDQQAEQIKALKYKTKKSMIAKDAEIESLALDIMDALSKDNVDVAAVNKIIDKKYEAKKQKAKELVNACVTLRATLTDEQRKKLKERYHSMQGSPDM